MFGILRMPKVGLGMVSVAFFFMGQFALFTYVRPFLEAVAHVNVSTLSSLLLIMGIAGLLGTYFIGVLLKTGLHGLLITMPLAMALIAVCLISFGGSLPAVAALLAAWGLIGTAAPVGWWTWLSKVLPDDAERGGGLMVAIIQLAITLGATKAPSVSAPPSFVCLLSWRISHRVQVAGLPNNEAVPETGIHEKHSSSRSSGARELACCMGIVLRRNRRAI